MLYNNSIGKLDNVNDDNKDNQTIVTFLRKDPEKLNTSEIPLPCKLLPARCYLQGG